MSDAESRAARAIEFARSGRLVCIVGPTASGKTELAIEVCEAIDGEIVSADSIQIYRGFDIGSGKPSAEEFARAPHHLVSTHDPLAPMDAAEWARLADLAIADIRARGKVAVVCGGTFLWVRALVLGLAEVPPADAAVRARHRAIAEEQGRPALHEQLAKIDPASAARLHPNDLLRVSRALEAYEVSGKTMSEWHAAHGFRGEPRDNAAIVAIAHDPAVLTERIAARVDHWLEQGWIDEVRALLDAGYGGARAMGSVGYAEVRAHIEGTLPRAELRDTIVRATRVFARHQRTWLNRIDVTWV